jgi:galactokinase
MVAIDFSCSEPTVKEVRFDFASKGYSLIITDVRQDHADLTCEYAAITNEMAQVSAYFGKKQLCSVSAEDFYKAIPALRASCTDRAILRAMHFFNENKRVDDAVLALENNNLQAFFDAVNSSGESSQCLLQNLFAQGSQEQGVPLALALARSVLKKRGAVRVHGGGFGGTVLGFVPTDLKEEYILTMNSVFGPGAAQELNIRKLSTTKID